MKQFKKSPISIACYVIAALVFVYFCYTIANTVATINNYYAQYGMTAQFSEIVSYVLQNGLTALTSAILIFMAGYILDEVRKQNPESWMTAEERLEAKEAKQIAKLEKQAAKNAAVHAAKEDEDAVPDIPEKESAVFFAETSEDTENDNIVTFGNDADEPVDEAEEVAAEEVTEEVEAAEDVAKEITEEAEAAEVATEEITEETEAAEVAAEEITEEAEEVVEETKESHKSIADALKASYEEQSAE